MHSVKIKNLNDDYTEIKEERIQLLKSNLRGEILFPSQESYDAERAIWNGMINKKPGLIIRCEGASDVIHSVRFAREHNLLISVRGGGHNISGNAVTDGGLMISLSKMKGITVDPVRRTATVQPGVRWGEVDKETQVFGLAAPGGIVSSTGIAGYTLGGGFGWISRKYGFAADNLISVDMVTAEGKFLTVNESENADLFWGLRGAGSNFGITTSFKFKLHPVGPNVVAGIIFYDIKDAKSVFNFYRDFAKNSPDELTSLIVLRLAPPAPFLPKELHGKPVIGISLLYCGEIEEGKKIVEPLKKFGNPIIDLITVKPYLAHQAMFDAGQLTGNQYYWKSEYLPGVNDTCAEVLLNNLSKITSPLTGVLIFQLKGQIDKINHNETAIGNRDAAFVININSCWENPDESEKHIKWTRDFWKSVKPFSTGGVYVNFLADDDNERVKSAYKENYEKLVSLKKKYDPSNFFRLNQNIKPENNFTKTV